jgi:chorismate dehydratase
MTFAVAMIPYANMAPYAELGPPPECRFVTCAPRESIAALKERRVWAAALPVGGLDVLADEVMPLGAFGIGAAKTCMSVLFFSDRSIAQFGRTLTIRLTAASASSVRLLYLLLGYMHGFDALPSRVASGAPANGELQIGDTALQWGHALERQGEVRGYRFVADLAELWHTLQKRSFVFARWVVRRDAPPALVRALDHWLQTFAGQEPELIQRAAPKVAAKLDLPLVYAERYLKTIRRCLTSADLEGQALFQAELQRHGLLAHFPWSAQDDLRKAAGR